MAAKINGTPSTPQNEVAEEVKIPTPSTPSMPEEPEEPSREEARPEFDRQALFSRSLSEQRYAWHKYLLSILSQVETENSNSLKHFSIYIPKAEGLNEQWADDAFKKELLQDIEARSDASHIGASSLSINIVSDKTMRRVEEDSRRGADFKLTVDGILLIGNRKQTDEEEFLSAIDKRKFVVNKFLKKFRQHTGTDSDLLAHLTIIVVRNEDDDLAIFDWVGEKFEKDLKLELANSFLEKIGSGSLQVVIRPQVDKDSCNCLIENRIYYVWETPEVEEIEEAQPEETPVVQERGEARITIIEDTGSLAKTKYLLDSQKKTLYHIGRGPKTSKGGKYRVNDIVIKEDEKDEELRRRNAYVSSAHADIIYRDNKFYLQACVGGCRARGGSPTKIIRNEEPRELRDTSVTYPLQDGDVIELGKSVMLLFTLK